VRSVALRHENRVGQTKGGKAEKRHHDEEDFSLSEGVDAD
jgi:hypothetical protein